MKKSLLILLLLYILTGKCFSQGAPACPNVSTTGATICQGQTATLTSTLVTNYQTTGYSVSSIPYSPYPYSGTPVNVGLDDIWSPVQSLGFNFCFFGNTYSNCIVGANGHICFNTTLAGAFDNYVVSATLPSTTNMPGNTINAVFRDIDPALGGNTYYQLGGTAPCRYVVISWSNVPLFDKGGGICNGTANSTFQMVLYENTNFIDVYIDNSVSCAAWNSGYGVVGIQNSAASVAVCPPGRNRTTFSVNGTPEAWRFTPTGTPNYTFTWTGPSSFSSTAQTINVSPSVTSTYTATMVYTNCDATTHTVTSTAVVVVNSSPTVTVNSPSACGGTPATLTASGAASYAWTPATGLSGTTGSSVTASPSSTTVYSVTGTSSGCSTTVPATVTVVPNPTITVNSATICGGSSATFTASGASAYVWTPSTGLSATTGNIVTSTATSSITYSVTGTTAGCSKTNTAVLTINPPPTITVNNPAVCSGSAATISASGATTYSWSNGMTGSSISVTPTVTTSYTVTGTSLGCTGTAVATVSVTNVPKLTVNDATICPGGTALLTAAGANSYTWSTAALTNTISVSPGTTQTYSVSGSIGSCISNTICTVTIGSGVAVTVPSATLCVGDVVTLTATGATTYTWSPGTGLSATIGSSVSANPTTTQSYTITGASGVCSGTTTAMVTVNPLPSVTVSSGTICVGNSTVLTASGASTYVWNPATGLSATTGSSVTANPASTQSYTVTGTSIAGCTNTATSIVTVNPIPVVTVNNPTICTGGTAVLTASGAAGYVWSTGGNTVSISVSPTATQVYTVTGSTSSCTATATSTVTVVTTPTVTVASATICTGNNTTLTANGATTYVWSPGTGLSGTSGSSVTANPTSTTTYSIVGTAGTCTSSATAIVTVNPLPVLSVTTPTICSGNSSLLTASGASTYSWSTGATNTNTISVSPAGNTSYTVTGTDANGCKNSTVGTVSVSASVTVTVNDPIICTGFTTTLTATGATTYSWNTGSTAQTITVSPTVTTSYTVTGTQNGCSATEFGTVTVVGTPTVTVTSATVCLGGGDTLTAMGASHYTWTPTTGLSSSTNSMVIASPTVTTTYTVLGVAGTCSATSTGVLTVNPLPTITATSGTICLGQQTATLTASGGITYTWSPSTSVTSSPGNPVVANPSSTQIYTVTGTDANGCKNRGTSTVLVNPLPIITATSGTICLGQQTATLTASGGTTYTWSPAVNITPTVGNPVMANPSSTQIYTITGTNANGCVNTGTTSVTVNPLPNVTATSTSVCPTFAGTITAGGASTYTWNTSFVGANLTLTPNSTTSYTVTGTDANTCTNTAVGTIDVFPTLTVTVNSSTICIGQQTATLTASGAVNYNWNPALNLGPATGSTVNATPNTTTIYTVTGVVGSCSATATSTVTVNPLPTITATSGIICLGQQTATLTANGGVTYTWTPATGLGNPTGPVVTGNPTATQTYVVTGTDANGCTNTGSAVITVLQLPIVTATSASVCPGAAGSITANGASTYSWNVTPPVASSILTQTPAATTNYIVTGTDTHGCTNTATGNIYVYNAFSISVNNASICAAGQQTATLTASGASTYVWSPVAGITSNTGSVVYSTSSAVSTVYTVVGTSVVGSCTASTTSNLTVNPLPQPIATSNTPCVSQQALSLSCTPTGLPLYTWAGPNSYTATGSNPTVASVSVTTGLAGVYTVTATDNNSCTNTAIVNVAVYSLPIITATVTPVCLGQTITLTASGGVSYVWSHQAEQPPFVSNQNPLVRPNSTIDMAGTYGITGTDANGCVSPGFATVVVNALPAVTATTSPICIGQMANITASGANTYTWSGSNLVLTNANPANANPTVTSIYNVTGTDINGCMNTATVSLSVNALPTVSVTPMAPECIPYCPTYTYTSNSPSAQSTYIWNFGGHDYSTQASPVHCFTVAGTWPVSLTLTDANGCVNTSTTSVTTFAVPNASFIYGQQPVSILAPEVQFANQSTPGLNYTWIFGDTAGVVYSATNPMHTYPAAGDYTVTLTVSTSQGCSSVTHEIIQIFDDYVLYVPNAFTPNGDGKNEIFKPVGEGITDYKLFIFDRWGSLIFFSDDIDKGWDGTYQAKNGEVLLQDVFVWKIQVSNVLNQSKDLNGTVTLLK